MVLSPCPQLSVVSPAGLYRSTVSVTFSEESDFCGTLGRVECLEPLTPFIWLLALSFPSSSYTRGGLSIFDLLFPFLSWVPQGPDKLVSLRLISRVRVECRWPLIPSLSPLCFRVRRHFLYTHGRGLSIFDLLFPVLVLGFVGI